MATRRFLVSGRVQGVGYRAATRQQAQALGLHGHARNLADGRVEVLAQGEPDALAKLESWLWRGPPLARVDAVIGADVETQSLAGFSIGW
ncbi:MAG: acylphosphatase [Xanthomonadales bacterium]|nr:Acylphosphatase [Xanthomonadales bacterium]MCC6593476.1 acylphosphatase [Xanthomonadales bacterium]MCE7929891.1 acylphosphatase [Xanthomonadales bacterium PRO6]